LITLQHKFQSKAHVPYYLVSITSTQQLVFNIVTQYPYFFFNFPPSKSDLLLILHYLDDTTVQGGPSPSLMDFS